MDKGFIRILEVFLAFIILFGVLNKVFISYPPTYTDPENIYRLGRTAGDISLAMCNNEDYRDFYVNNSLPSYIDLNSSVPTDINYDVYLYTNLTADSRLDDVIYASRGYRLMNSSECVFGNEEPPTVGAPCTGSGTFNPINATDNLNQSILGAENMSANFTPNAADTNRVMAYYLIVAGYGGTSGTVSIIFRNSSAPLSYGNNGDINFSFTTTYETRVFDVTSYLPVAGDNSYRIHFNNTAEYRYDFVGLREIRDVSPRDRAAISHSCLVAGYLQPNITELLPDCIRRTGGGDVDCTEDVNTHGGLETSTGSTSNISLDFGVYSSNIRKMKLLIAIDPDSTATDQSIMILNSTAPLTYRTVTTIDTTVTRGNLTFDLDGWLPDFNSRLNVTLDVVSSGNTIVDYARLAVQTGFIGNNIYAPRKIVVVAWNR